MKKNVVIVFEKGSSEPVNAELNIEIVELPEFAELSDGEYIVNVVDGVATWALNPLPTPPTVNGNYQLTVLEGVLTWTLIA